MNLNLLLVYSCHTIYYFVMFLGPYISSVFCAELEDEDEEEEGEFDQTQCTKCGHDDHPETILLCDNCDAGWHLSCLRPPLLSVPEGDWVCPTCEHVCIYVYVMYMFVLNIDIF